MFPETRIMWLSHIVWAREAATFWKEPDVLTVQRTEELSWIIRIGWEKADPSQLPQGLQLSFPLLGMLFQDPWMAFPSHLPGVSAKMSTAQRINLPHSHLQVASCLLYHMPFTFLAFIVFIKVGNTLVHLFVYLDIECFPKTLSSGVAC